MPGGFCALLLAALALQTPEQQAADHFARGVKLYDKGNFVGALAEFEAAWQKTHAWEVLLNIGVTEENLLHYNEAVRALDGYLKDGGERVPADRRARVENELRHIRSVVGEVLVKVPGAPATVELDERVVGPSPLPEALLVAAGVHRLRATRAGELAAERTVEVKVGERSEIELAPAPTPKRPTTADLLLDSRPPNASLTIDGRPVGTAPWRQTLGEGTYEVAGALPGRAVLKQRVELRGGVEKSVLLNLPELPPPPKPFFRRWYVWAGLGAIVAAGVVVSAFALRTDYDIKVRYPSP